ncbi:MAG: stage IV sporulation protein A, partial [Lachnospiraceae bacterium]
MESFNVYKDMQARTGGEIYIGIVGPVRTGKSTFIKRFMDLLVLPNMEDEHSKMRTRDELPQSASGKTIMTTEPKFVPKEAAQIRLDGDVEVKVRLIDCVGYMAEGASGHIENEMERQVKTPWFDYEIPFTQAAAIGTRKVIHEHATIGIVITTDGSIGDLPRESFLEPEEKTIRELQSIGKPFVVLVNSQRPYSEEAKNQASELEERYKVKAMAVNCEQLRE